MLVGTTTDGEGDRIGPRRPRSDVRLLREGCPRKLSRSAHLGPRNPARETIARRPAPTSLQTCLVFSAPRPRPSKSPGIHRKKLWVAPERSRSAIISRTGWRWGQSRANPSRTSISEQKTNTRISDQSPEYPASEASIDSASSSRRLENAVEKDSIDQTSCATIFVARSP